MDLHDVLVVDARRRQTLAQKALLRGLHGRVQHLEGDALLEAPMLGLVHHGHAAAADLAQHGVGPEVDPRPERHRAAQRRFAPGRAESGRVGTGRRGASRSRATVVEHRSMARA